MNDKPNNSDLEAQTSSFRPPTSAPRPPTVLLVDDDKSIRTTLSAFLASDGYAVEVAGDEQEAHRVLKAHDFDVVVSDIVMPGKSGIDLLQSIRATSPLSQVVMMTGEPTADTAAEALRFGALDYLTKPAGKAAVLRAVGNAVKVKQLDDERRRLESENQSYQKGLEQLVVERTGALAEAKRMTETARESEARFRALFNGGADAILLHGIAEDGLPTAFVEVNEIACRLYGYSREELMCMTPLDLEAPTGTDRDPWVPPRLQAEGQAIFETVIASKEGHLIPVEVACQLLQLEGDRMAVSVARDITARKREEARRAAQYKVARILATAPSLVAASLPVIEAVCKPLGWDYGEMWEIDESTNMLRCADIWHGPLPALEAFATQSRALSFAPGLGLPGQVWRSGQVAWVSDLAAEPEFPRASDAARAGLHACVAIPLALDGKVLGVMELLSCEVKQRDAELLTVMVTLGAQVGQFLDRKRAERDIRAAKEIAESANRAKSDFLASMSHELRTPLGAIIGFSELLAERFFGDLNDKQDEYVTDIMESGRHLLALINDILDLSKVEAGKMVLELTTFPVASLIENGLVMVKEKCLKHGIELSVDIDDSVRDLSITADERKLKQVLFNLLSNAAKFTPADGSICVRAKCVSECRPAAHNGTNQATDGMQSAIEISVTDSGIGLAAEDQDKVFEEFYQTEGGRKGKTAGTGLGLALVRRMVELHGGVAWGRSAGKNKGSTFAVAIPIQPTALLGDEARPQAPQRSAAWHRTEVTYPVDGVTEEALIAKLAEALAEKRGDTE